MSRTPKPARKPQPARGYRLQDVPVERIRPEDGLGRRRDRAGHDELRRSIEQFGVLTPITVRPAPSDSGDYLLIKGQGRTLACRLLGLPTIPAIVVDADQAENEKVQQFLVENVARLKMAPVDRALLMTHARKKGEETIDVARRFGVTPSTVRRLEAQLDGASKGEVAALRAGGLNLSVHAAIAKHVRSDERSAVIACVAGRGIGAAEMDALLRALDYRALIDLGPEFMSRRLALLEWVARTMTELPRSNPRERLRQVAQLLPTQLPAEDQAKEVG